MKLIHVVTASMIIILSGCTSLTPDLFNTVDDIATDGVVQVQIDKEAFEKQTNTKIMIDVSNRDTD